jgi:hypothetical protein
LGSDRIRTRTSELWVEDDILYGREAPGTETTYDDAVELVAELRKLGGSVRRPLVMNISDSKSVTREARTYLAGDEMATVASVIALVVGSALARALGSFFLTFNRPKFGVKLFTSVEEATEWARTFKQSR